MSEIPAVQVWLSFTRRGTFALLLVLAAGPAMAVECGDVITRSARLDRDLICTTDGPALKIQGGSLDLNGFTVVCDQAEDQARVGVLLEGHGARLRDGAVTGCFLAVHVAGEGHHRSRA